jgi:hypothetical protein
MPKPSKGKARKAERRTPPPAAASGAAPIEAPPPGDHARPSRIAYAVIAIALVCCLYPRHSWKTYRNVNEQARLYLVKAVVEEGVLNIDNGIKTLQRLQDKATKDGVAIATSRWALVCRPLYCAYHAGRLFGRVDPSGDALHLTIPA